MKSHAGRWSTPARLCALALLLVVAGAQAAALVVAVAGAAVSSWVAGAIGGAVLFGTFTVGKLVGAIAGFAVSSLLGGLLGNQSGGKEDTGYGGSGSFQSEASGRMQVVRSAAAARTLVYGEVMVSGPLVYAEVGGANNRNVHLVIPLANHEVEAIGDVYFNDVKIEPGALGATGEVVAGPFSGHARIVKHLGISGDPADADLVAASAGKWTAAHRLAGIAYLYIRLDYSQDVYPGGIPNVKARVKGKKLYDPRTGLTAWSNNWALVVRDYLTTPALSGGLGVTDSEVDDAQLSAAANVCDEAVPMAAYSNTFSADAATDTLTFTTTERTIGTGDGVRVASDGALPAGLAAATTYYFIRLTDTTAQLATTAQNARLGTAIDITDAGSGTLTLSHIDQVRYTADGTVDTSRRPLDIIRDLLSAGAGVLTYPQGVFKAWPGAYAAPSVTLTASDLRGPVQLTTRIARRDLFNAVKGTYSNPANFWQPSDFPQVSNATYAVQDGGDVITRDIDLPFTTDAIRAQRIARINLEKSRQGMTVVFSCNMRQAFGLAMWDTVSVTLAQLGWSAKVFRVVKWELAGDGLGVDLTLREESSASYSWNSGDATVVDPAPDTVLPSPFVVAAPGAPTVTESLYTTSGSAGVKSRVTADWAASADAFVRQYEPQYKATNDATWYAFPWQSGTTLVIDDVTPGTYDVRVRAINALGIRSAYSPEVTVEIKGITALPEDVANFSVLASAGFALASWDLTGDLDVQIGGRVVVRHAPVTSGATWSAAVILEQFAGSAVSGTVPLITGTYLCKFLDSAGNYSENAATFVATEGMVTGLSTLATITESTSFTGSKYSAHTRNLCAYSEDLTNGVYFSTQVGVTTFEYVTLTNTADPFIGQTINLGSSVLGRSFRFGVELKGSGASVGKQVRILIYDHPSVGEAYSELVGPLTADYQLFEIGTTFASSTDTQIRVRVDPEGSPAWNIGELCYATRWRCNEGAALFDYEPTRVDLVVAGGELKLSSGATIDSAATIDGIVDIDGMGGVSSFGMYDFAGSYDGTTVAVRRFEADIAVSATDTGDTIDARGDVDDWGSVDGSVINDCDATLYARTTNDDPAGSPTWGEWTPFFVADFNCRAAQFYLRLDSGSPTHQIAVSTLAVDIKA